MSTATLSEVQSRLPELLNALRPGEEMTIVELGQAVAHLKKAERTSWPCTAGSAQGKIRIAPDFDEPLEEFKE